MGIGRDWLNRLVIGALVIVLGLLAFDEFGYYLAPGWKRFRSRFLPDRLSWHMFLPLIVGLILALLFRAPLISAFLVAAGVAVSLVLMERARRNEHALPAREIFQLVLAFRGTFQLQPSVFLTLDLVRQKVSEPLRGLVEIVVQTYYLTSSPQRAFEELRARTSNVYLHQFVYILEMSETAQPSAVVNALDNLVDRLRSHEELRRESEANLTSVTGQTSFIQTMAVLVLAAVAAVPTLRTPYTTTGGQVLLIAVITVMLVASYYIYRVIQGLSERIS